MTRLDRKWKAWIRTPNIRAADKNRPQIITPPAIFFYYFWPSKPRLFLLHSPNVMLQRTGCQLHHRGEFILRGKCFNRCRTYIENIFQIERMIYILNIYLRFYIIFFFYYVYVTNMSNSMCFLTSNNCIAYTRMLFQKYYSSTDSCCAWKEISKHSGVIHKHRLLTFRSVIEARVGERQSKCAQFDSIIATR